MRPGGRSAALLLVLSLSLICLIAGCGGSGGGEGQSDAGSQNGGSDGQQGGSQNGGSQQGGSGGPAPESKIALGTIRRVNVEARRVVIKPNVEGQDQQQAKGMTFNVRKNAEISLGGEGAEMGAVAQGQNAQIEYIVQNERNRALSVELFEGGETPASEQGEPDTGGSGGEGTG